MSLINTRSADQILADMVTTFQAVQPDVNINEASPIYILMQIFAFNAALNTAVAQNFALSAFLATSEGDNLTALAEDRGITRIAATYSTIPLQFSRLIADYVNTYTIPASTEVSTVPDENGKYYSFKTFDTLTLSASSLSVTGWGQASASGADYNVVANTVTNFINTVAGIDNVNNTSDASGGTDQETDDALRARVKTVLASNAAKTTVSGYQNTLVELGAKSAFVYSPSGSMPNYITAVVTSPNTADTIPTTGELTYWQAQINLDENRAVADVITVVAPSTVTITVSALITSYTIGADQATTKALVKTNVINYINGLSPDTDVFVTGIANVIHDTDGVADYTLYSPSSNTVISNIQKAIATTGSVTIN